MIYNFDRIINRKNTDCIKYDHLNHFFGNEDILPLWVADMDFEVAPCISEAIQKRAEHNIYGYTSKNKELNKEVCNWMQIRHNWEIKKEWISFSPGVVTALAISILSLTNKKDKIIIQPPVYPPFFSVAKDNNRELLLNPLIFKNEKYTFDFAGLEELAKQGAKMLILCNPHNPVGRAWTRAELSKIGDICKKYDILVLSDEIHSDLVLRNYKHIPIASVSEDLKMRTITCMAPSKTFNVAGLASSIIIIANDNLRKKYNSKLESLHLNLGNVFGHTATLAGYKYGSDWLDQLLEYIENNIVFIHSYLSDNLPKVKLIKPEATYLVWLDFSSLNMNNEDLQNFMVNTANVGLNNGNSFGSEGNGFLRMNIACPRSIIKKALDRISNAITTL